LACASAASIERLYALKRRVLATKHAVTLLLEAVGHLQGGRVPLVCQGVQDYFRDVFDHLARVNSSIDPIRDTVATAMQANLSMVTIEENEITKRLAAWAAIFGVSTTLAGTWGMNFKHMPELRWQYGYPLALVSITGICAVLFWRFRKSRRL
jgi:magnesium transporter